MTKVGVDRGCLKQASSVLLWGPIEVFAVPFCDYSYRGAAHTR